MRTHHPRYHWPLDTLGWLALALLTIALSRYTNLDLTVSAWFYDPSIGGFPLRDNRLYSHIFHDGARKISTIAWLLCWVMAWRARHSEALFGWLFVIITALIAVSVNGYFKHHSLHSCPWSLHEFGGAADYFRIFSAAPTDSGPGKCLPSGHAGTGFMWIALIYACATWWPEHLRKAILIILPFALFCGATQIVRGAHFVTHVMWSAVICGLTTSACFHLYRYRAALGVAMVRIGHRLAAESAS